MANTTGRKYGGRKKGTTNKLTKEIRSILKELVCEEFESLRDNLGKLNPSERLDVLIKLMPYVLPKVKPIDMKAGEPFDYEELLK